MNEVSTFERVARRGKLAEPKRKRRKSCGKGKKDKRRAIEKIAWMDVDATSPSRHDKETNYLERADKFFFKRST